MTQEELIRALVRRCVDVIAANAEALTALDQAIGDGDHGSNLNRGFMAIDGIADELAGLEFGPALGKAGMTLVMKVGGASGPLYGSALMAMGKFATAPPGDRTAMAALLQSGIDAVKARGKSDVGAKTMLDVLAPVQAALAAGASLAEIRAAADQAVEATRPMRATKGRAAFLGERSIGHIDPGGQSSALLVHAVCDVLENR